MLSETFIAATEAVNKPSAHLSSALKDVGIFHYELQPQTIFRHGYKKSSVKPSCFAISDSHIFAAQGNKAVIHVYNRQKGNQEATVPFPDKIYSLAYSQASAILIIGTEDGKLVLWETATGRISSSAASHLEPVSSLVVTKDSHVISGSADSSVHVWSLAKLVDLAPAQSYSNSDPIDAPLRTFSNHRGGITALAAGNSRTNTNFVVSAASDRTCYLWHIETCQVLRTFLTPAVSITITLDPADRAVYLGNEDGTIQSIDLFGGKASKSKQSIYHATDAAPIQLITEDNWTAPSSDKGAAHCLALSYDSTTLLSGHSGGTIVKWDVAKHRLVSEVANLHQPVTNLHMLTPDGLRHQEPNYSISTIVKPRLELNAESTESTVGLPASYSLTAQVTKPAPTSTSSNEINAILAGSLFPDSMLNDALQAMNVKSAGLTHAPTTTTSNKNDTYRIQALEEEKALLEKKLAVMQKMHQESRERHMHRSEAREKLGLQRREAYFAAKKKGKDGDEAMKPFEKKIQAIDAESDEEELRAGDAMDLDS